MANTMFMGNTVYGHTLKHHMMWFNICQKYSWNSQAIAVCNGGKFSDVVSTQKFMRMQHTVSHDVFKKDKKKIKECLYMLPIFYLK
jgi:hypothetical protein